jgi:Eco29kI-like restriction endonuclease
MAGPPYNPLDKRNLAESVATALLKRPIGLLPPIESFDGAGIYAIYYAGDFRPYRSMAARNKSLNPSHPIYIGKAVPPGSRKGGFALGSTPGTALYRRLREHAQSIDEAQNLRLSDFCCRFLVSEDIWIPLGESLLIEEFRPIWNVLIEGFGIHQPGKRRPQRTSKWDTLHPGRKLASGLPANALTFEHLTKMVEDFFEGKPVKTLSAAEAMTEEESELELED